MSRKPQRYGRQEEEDGAEWRRLLWEAWAQKGLQRRSWMDGSIEAVYSPLSPCFARNNLDD